MDNETMQQHINAAFDDIDNVSTATTGDVRDAVNGALDALDSGQLRVAEKTNGDWQVNQWLKKAVLLSFRLNDMQPQSGGPQGTSWWDKVPSKFDGWGADEFGAACAWLCSDKAGFVIGQNILLDGGAFPGAM